MESTQTVMVQTLLAHVKVRSVMMILPIIGDAGGDRLGQPFVCWGCNW